MNSISVNDMLERLQDYIFGELASGVGIEHHVLTQNTVAVLAATIVVGLLIGFLGWKIVRVWAALAGFGLGFILGVLISADRCARAGLRALWRGRRSIVPDWWNRLWIPICKMLPMWIIRPLRKFTMQFQK